MQRRHLRFAHLDEAVQEISRLQACGYDRAGNWSLEQIVDHLNRAMRMAVDGPPFMLPAPLRPLLKWLFFGRMQRGEMLKLRGRAPASMQPTADSDFDAGKAEFASLAAVIESDETPLAPVHPVFGRFRRDEWRVMQRWHAAHHLGFLTPRE